MSDDGRSDDSGLEHTVRVIGAGLAASTIGSVGALVAYWSHAGVQAEGLGVAVAFGGLALATAAWAKRAGSGQVAIEVRHTMPSSDEQRRKTGETASLDDPPLSGVGVGRRRGLRALGALAGATLLAALTSPLRSLGSNSLRALRETGWQAGSRLVDSEGTPIRLGDLEVGTVVTAFPERDETKGDSQVVLIRMRESDLRMDEDRIRGTEQGHVAYSKVCTHAGCPVGLFDTDTDQLICPCHQSVFLASDGARPTAGPAARALPQLPIGLDADGFFVALGDFPEPVGPSFWSLTSS